jgi:putative endonuclease
MPSYSVYILYSRRLDRYYTGTTDDVVRRLSEHNSGAYKGSYSVKGIPWELFYELSCPDGSTAYKIERHIKRMRSRVYIENLKKYPELGKGLVLRYGSYVQPRKLSGLEGEQDKNGTPAKSRGFS